jgi:Na+/proline symporter
MSVGFGWLEMAASIPRRLLPYNECISGKGVCLSLGVYCTTWTFYGSVGRAAASGIGFLPIYLGPTLLFALAGFILHKMIRIAKANRITSIADFVASRYGKSQLLGGLVTVIAVVGVIPYIALQLKAVSNSFTILAATRRS